ALARVLDRHEVHDLADALAAEEARHQDVAVGHVHLLLLGLVQARDAEGAPLLVVEDCREDAGRVAGRQTAPVDGPVDPDQGDGVQVADDAVGLDRLVAHGSFPLVPLRSPRGPPCRASALAEPPAARRAAIQGWTSGLWA